MFQSNLGAKPTLVQVENALQEWTGTANADYQYSCEQTAVGIIVDSLSIRRM